MNANKVTIKDQIIIDLTSDTVTAATLLSGHTAHDKAGNIVTGIALSAKPEQEKSAQITENGDFEIVPDTGNTLTRVIVHVNVPSGSSSTELLYSSNKPNSIICEGNRKGNWTIAVLESCDIIFSALPSNSVDVFLGGRGGKGVASYVDGNVLYGGNGGDGGYIKTFNDVTISEGTSYHITVSGTDIDTGTYLSSAFGKSNSSSDSYRRGGQASHGSNSGWTQAQWQKRDEAINGFPAFGDGESEYKPGYLYGAPGGGGGLIDWNNNIAVDGGWGGKDGAGYGGTTTVSGQQNGSNAIANSCSGGGGGKGNGGSGIVLIRNHRRIL